MAALRAAHAGYALVEDAAVEIAVDRRLDTAAQVAVAAASPIAISLQGTALPAPRPDSGLRIHAQAIRQPAGSSDCSTSQSV